MNLLNVDHPVSTIVSYMVGEATTFISETDEKNCIERYVNTRNADCLIDSQFKKIVDFVEHNIETDFVIPLALIQYDYTHQELKRAQSKNISGYDLATEKLDEYNNIIKEPHDCLIQVAKILVDIAFHNKMPRESDEKISNILNYKNNLLNEAVSSAIKNKKIVSMVILNIIYAEYGDYPDNWLERLAHMKVVLER